MHVFITVLKILSHFLQMLILCFLYSLLWDSKEASIRFSTFTLLLVLYFILLCLGLSVIFWLIFFQLCLSIL